MKKDLASEKTLTVENNNGIDYVSVTRLRFLAWFCHITITIKPWSRRKEEGYRNDSIVPNFKQQIVIFPFVEE